MDGWCMGRIDEDKWAMIMPRGIGAGRRHGGICWLYRAFTVVKNNKMRYQLSQRSKHS
jgi:hypothetical protein